MFLSSQTTRLFTTLCSSRYTHWAEGVGQAPPGGVWVGVWFNFRLYYPFSKGVVQHMIRYLKNKKCENERTNEKRQIITIPIFNINIQINHFKIKFHILNTLPTYKYKHFKTTFMCPCSITGVPFDSDRRFRATLLLRTTCMRL